MSDRLARAAEQQLAAALRAWQTRDYGRALRLARSVDHACLHNPRNVATLGSLLGNCGELAAARVCHQRTWNLSPENPEYIQSYAGALMAAGEFDQARELLSAAVQQFPQHAALWFALSQNQRHSGEDSLADEIESLIRSPQFCERDRVFLHYALGKVFDDLGHYDRAFEQFRQGAGLRRKHLHYHPENDTNGIRAIKRVFSDAGSAQQDGTDNEKVTPIFVAGLPRSGTTLVERIIGSHPQVESVGESPAFTHALMSLLRDQSATTRLSREQVIEASVSLDFSALGQRYHEFVALRNGDSSCFIDKMPLNFLYVALIRRALPGSKIILLRRDAMDNCWSMYSTLFHQAYPFSYDFEELAHYYAASASLIEHWRNLFPADILSISYESLTANSREETERMLRFAGLDWDDACVRFHDNPSPTATASMVQVRQPVYRSSVGRWKNYEARLKPLVRALESHGIETASR